MRAKAIVTSVYGILTKTGKTFRLGLDVVKAVCP